MMRKRDDNCQCESHMTDHVILSEQSSLELKHPELLPRVKLNWKMLLTMQRSLICFDPIKRISSFKVILNSVAGLVLNPYIEIALDPC